MSRTSCILAAASTVVVLSGCGFVAAGQKSHIKPNGFVLIGHAATLLPPGDHRAAGSPCQAPGTITDLGPSTSVKVVDPTGNTIALGNLGSGTVDRDGPAPTCDFPFQIRDVPGGVTTYGVAIGNRPPEPFRAVDLRQNTSAVITITR